MSGVEPLSSSTSIRFLHAYFGLKIRQRRTERNSTTFLNPIFQTTLFRIYTLIGTDNKENHVPRMFVPTLPWCRWIKPIYNYRLGSERIRISVNYCLKFCFKWFPPIHCMLTDLMYPNQIQNIPIIVELMEHDSTTFGMQIRRSTN